MVVRSQKNPFTSAEQPLPHSSLRDPMITKNNSSSSIHSQHLSTSFVTSRSPQQGQAQHLEVRVPIEDPQLTVHGHYDPQNPQSPQLLAGPAPKCPMEGSHEKIVHEPYQPWTRSLSFFTPNSNCTHTLSV